MTAAALAFVALCSAWIALGLASLAWVRFAPRRRVSGPLPGVTVLKPLCGVDPGLSDNLRSFFEQDHAGVQLVFGVEGEDDRAAEVVRALAREYPGVRATLVVHDGRGCRAQNPKVRNLGSMLPYAAHDLILVSDANVRAPRHYVRELAALWASTPGVGLVTNLFAGRGERTLGAGLECVHLAGFVAPGSALPSLLGDATVIGKSMLLSRRALARLGGLERVADVLAEDYVLGKLVQRAVGRVVVAPTVLVNVVGRSTVRAFFARHLRWSMLRVRLRPFTFLLEPLTSPLAVLPAAWLALGPSALAWAAGAWLSRDVGGWLLLRGPAGLIAPALLGPLRDLVMLGAFAAAPFKRHVRWRGRRVRVGPGTLLFEEDRLLSSRP